MFYFFFHNYSLHIFTVKKKLSSIIGHVNKGKKNLFCSSTSCFVLFLKYLFPGLTKPIKREFWDRERHIHRTITILGIYVNYQVRHSE